MSTYTDVMTLTEKLNGLLEKNKDAEKGYEKAAENAQSLNLKTYFKRKHGERMDFCQQLKAEIRTFGAKPEDSGSVTGALHRTWMEVKTWFSADTDEAMLEEAIRGEKAAVAEYKEVLGDVTLPPSTSALLTMQMDTISADLATIKSLEDLA